MGGEGPKEVCVLQLVGKYANSPSHGECFIAGGGGGIVLEKKQLTAEKMSLNGPRKKD